LKNIATNIRPAAPADLPVLRKVVDATELFPGEMIDEMIAPFFAGGDCPDGWLTYDTGKGPQAVVYYAPERMTEGTWNLYLIAVHPTLQGQGIGAALMAHVEQTLAQAGHRILLVETSDLPDFERTRNFYHKIKYTEEARIREFYTEGEGKVVFWKKLSL